MLTGAHPLSDSRNCPRCDMPQTKSLYELVAAAAESEQRALSLMARAEGLLTRSLRVADAVQSEENSAVKTSLLSDSLETWAACASVTAQIVIALRRAAKDS